MKEKNLATLSFIVSLKTMATCEMFFKIYLPLSVHNPLNESRCFRAGPSWLATAPGFVWLRIRNRIMLLIPGSILAVHSIIGTGGMELVT